VAEIKVGAATETEMKERKALLEDARAATQAALAEGVVPGGGVSLLRSEKSLDKLGLEGDEKLGAEIIRKVLEYPLRYIAENAGVEGPVVVNRVRQMKGKNDGYNADKDEYGDMIAAGVIDPAKVVRTALQNAASVASLLLTTDSLVTEIPKKEEEAAGGHDHHDHGMGGMGGMGGGMGGMGGMM
jgi:chaperonin GroEL